MPDDGSLATRRWLFLLLVAGSTLAGVVRLWSVLRYDGLTLAEGLFLLLFAILFGWIVAAFWLAVFGAALRLEGSPLLPFTAREGKSQSRTAVLMPVYNEDVARVFAGVQAIYDSARDAGEDFDFYILSDSTDPAHWIAEEVEWERLRRLLPDARIFYRHRIHNIGRKSGNIQDFCENWGALYDYMVVLDADSLMTGETLGALVRLMDANPRAGLIQVPARLVGRKSLFARIQQFAASVYGPTFAGGLAAMQGPDGNYWGHNAIIRVRAFLAHGGLPQLPGKPPFGGEIMSHDFVEAAFLIRAGWEVWMAPDLSGSYEEPPPTVYDYLKRDRRWAQGNLQHSRVIVAQGLKTPSRLHMVMGIMSYLSSPLWLLLLIVSAFNMKGWHAPPPPADPYMPQPLPPDTSGLVGLVVATVILLFAPKLIALAMTLSDRAVVRAHGGYNAVIGSVLWESLFSTLLAPVVMLAHSWFVFTIIAGIATGWGPQARDDRALPFWFVASRYWPHTLIGAAAAFALWRFAPAEIYWFAPLLAGLLLSVPLVQITSSLKLGEMAERRGFFLIPSETGKLPVLERAHRLLEMREDEDTADFLDRVLDDATVTELHVRMLREAGVTSDAPPEKLAQLVETARRREVNRLSRADWVALLSDADSVLAASVPGDPGAVALARAMRISPV